MRLAIPWTSNKQNYDISCEYNIEFINKPNNFDNLIEFLSNHPQDRFNISIDISEYEFDFSKLNILNKINPNIYIKLSPLTANQQKLLKELNIKFFFDSSYSMFSYRMLEDFAALGVTDVYIADDLCYDLINVKKACEKLGISIRWILDVIPSNSLNKNKDPRAPWVIPEIIDELSQYVDTFEFSEDQSWAKLDTLYKIWFKKRQWKENLKALYPQLEIDIWNQSILPELVKYKLNCRYKCIYGSVCKKCNQNIEIADNLHKKGFFYDLPKEEAKEF